MPYNDGMSTNSPTKLTEVYTEMEAAMIVAALKDNGIEAHLTGEYTSQFRAESLGNVNVLVNEADLARAQQILSEFGSTSDPDTFEENSKHLRTAWQKTCRILVILGLVGTLVMFINSLVSTF